MLKKLLTISFIVTALSAGVAEAKHDKHDWKHDKKHNSIQGWKKDHKGKKNNVVVIDRSDRVIINNYYNDYYLRNCPPGLAKKHNGCLPPGHAKKFKRGEIIPVNVRYVYVPDDLAVRLHRYDNARYVAVDRDVYLMDTNTRKVLDIISIASTIR